MDPSRHIMCNCWLLQREKKNFEKTSTFKGSYRNTSKATKILQEVYFFLPIEFDAINFDSSVLQKGEKIFVGNFITSLGLYFVSKIVLVIKNKFSRTRCWKSRFYKFLRSLEQFVWTMKGQNNFWNSILFSCSWRFPRSI